MSKTKKRKMIIWSGAACAALVLLIFLLSLTVWYWPSIVINQKTIGIFAGHLAKKDILIRWDKIEVEALSKNFYKKTIELNLINPNILLTKNNFEFNADAINVRATFDISLRGFRITDVGSILITKGYLNYSTTVKSAAKKGNTSFSLKDFDLPYWIKDASVGKIDIEVLKSDLSIGDIKLKHQIIVSNRPGKQISKWIFNIKDISDNSSPFKLKKLRAEIEAPLKLAVYPDTIKAEAELGYKDLSDAFVNLNVSRRKDKIFDVLSEFKGINRKEVISGSVKGQITDKNISGTINSQISYPLIKQAKDFKIKNMKFAASLDTFSPEGGDFTSDGEIILDVIAKENPLKEIINPARINLDISLQSAGISFLRLKPDLPLNLNIKSSAQDRFNKGKRINAQMKLKLAKDKYEADLNAQLDKIHKHLTKINFNNCKIQTNDRILSFEGGELSFSCVVEGQIFLEKSNSYAELFQKPIKLVLDANINNISLKKMKNKIAGDVEAKLEKIETQAASLYGFLKSDFDYKIGQSLDKTELNYMSDLKIEITDFDKAKNILKEHNFQLPAPISVLEGKALLSLYGKGSTAKGVFHVPVKLELDLKSDNQLIYVNGNGSVTINTITAKPHFLIDFFVDPSGSQIILPTLQIKKPPSLISDSRIKTKSEIKAKEKTQIDYRVTVETAEGKPVKIASNLSQGPIPVGLNLNFESGKNAEGAISIKEFGVNIFKRKALIKYFNIKMSSELAQPFLNGEIESDYGDYLIKIIVTGPSDRPTVTFLSNPPLSQDQIVSVLIYGRTIEELDPVESESVGNMEAAVADRAIGLASLYFLSSTKIQSIGYNPITKVFSAKVNLGFGTTIYYGTDWDKYQKVGVRKRLGSNWSIQAYTENPTKGKDYSVTTLLEWFTRY